MMRYNEALLIAQLTRMSSQGRAIFALTCATRLYPCYKQYITLASIENDIVGSALAYAWRSIKEGNSRSSVLEDFSVGLEAVLDGEEDDDGAERQLAFAAIYCASYAVKAIISGKAEDAAFSARQAYEATDAKILADIPQTIVTEQVEYEILSNELVQTELARQARDIEQLAVSDSTDALLKIEEFRSRAYSEPSIP